jgi:hypothetical protein
MTDAIPSRVATTGTSTTAWPTQVFGVASTTSVEPDVYDELSRAFLLLAMAMRKWKDTL